MLSVQASTIGPATDIDSAQNGTVHSVFRHAVNIEVGRDLWTLLASGQPDLPFGVRLVLNDCGALRATRGAQVAIRAGFIGIGRCTPETVVDCRSAIRWQRPMPREIAPRLESRLALLASLIHDRCWNGSAAMAENVMGRLAGDPHSLGEVLGAVVGRGPGLTPAGDDVLVGIFAGLTLAPSTQAVAQAQVLARALDPHLASTCDLSAHLLRQASRGLFGRALHELVSALAADTPPDLLHARIDRVVKVGATSGADACAGVLAATRHLFLLHIAEKAAA